MSKDKSIVYMICDDKQIKMTRDVFDYLMTVKHYNKKLKEEIVKLKIENEKLYMFIYDFILRLEHIRDNGSKKYIKENLDIVIKYMNEKFEEYYKLEGLKESGNNE